MTAASCRWQVPQKREGSLNRIVYSAGVVALAIALIAWGIWYFSDDQRLHRCAEDVVKKVQSGQMTTQKLLAGANDSNIEFTPEQVQTLGGLIAAAPHYCKHSGYRS